MMPFALSMAITFYQYVLSLVAFFILSSIKATSHIHRMWLGTQQQCTHLSTLQSENQLLFIYNSDKMR